MERNLLILSLSLVACSGTADPGATHDAGSPAINSVADVVIPGSDDGIEGQTDAGPRDGGGIAGDDAGPADDDMGAPEADGGEAVLPTAFRGIPERPFADVELPAQGTVEPGARTCIGTPDNPAFIIGDGQEFTNSEGKWELEAEHCIVANVNFRGKILARQSNNVEFRNISAHHADGNCLSIGGNDIAVVDSHFHHCQGDNGHGIQPGCGTSRVWVTGNLLEYNDEDGFQSGHRCTGNEPDQLYFYGNTCNNNRENCFDVKWTNRVVVSGNLMRRHLVAQNGEDFQFDDGSFDGDVNSGSDGTAVVIGSDGTPTTTFLFDNVYTDNVGCVRIEDAQDVYASGEACSNAIAGSNAGGYIFDKSGHTRLVESTFDNVPFMITDRFRENPTVDEGSNTRLGGTEYRQGFNATVNENTATEADIEAAYQAVFGRPL